MLYANEQRVLDAANELVTRIGASPNHTVAAAAMDTEGRRQGLPQEWQPALS